ncbi:MAG: phosphoribosylanthranilate isomerase [Dehalococcoidia bacterium]|nr:phosphoribosylanthranilate isomerase [Dehalococcoidia bacterium]
MTVIVKICGQRTSEHALAAANGGADMIGMIFALGRRQITPEVAKEIVQSVRKDRNNPPKMVGVFVNAPAADVNRIAAECALDMIQLSGGEPWSYCSQIKVPVIKVIHIDESGAGEGGFVKLANTCQEATIRGYTIHLESGADRMPGGTGKTFDWSIAERLSQHFKFLLAGGLTPGTVSEAIHTAHPWGVDVSSGVETDGVKDIAKIEAFIKAAKGA